MTERCRDRFVGGTARLLRCAAACVALLAPGAASADRLILTGGTAFDGRVEIVEGLVKLHLERAAVSYPIGMVERIEWGGAPAEEYAERAAALAAGDAEGHAELARWCRECHLRESYVRELLAVGRASPFHPLAEELAKHGYVRRDGEWVSVEYHMMKEGRKLYRGEWLPAEEVEARTRAERGGGQGAPARFQPGPAPAQRARPSLRDGGRGKPSNGTVKRRRRYVLIIGPGGGLIDRR